MNKIYIFLLLILNACCLSANKKNQNEEIFKNVCEIKENVQNNNELAKKIYYSLGIIGQVEPVYLKDIEAVFLARIDTGAETSSIDSQNVKEFERDGESWVSFEIKNRETGEKKVFEKKIVRKTSIKRQQGGDESRITVKMEIKIGNSVLNKDFTLANREKFDYQVLIGRNILNGLAVVDVSIKNTLN